MCHYLKNIPIKSCKTTKYLDLGHKEKLENRTITCWTNKPPPYDSKQRQGKGKKIKEFASFFKSWKDYGLAISVGRQGDIYKFSFIHQVTIKNSFLSTCTYFSLDTLVILFNILFNLSQSTNTQLVCFYVSLTLGFTFKQNFYYRLLNTFMLLMYKSTFSLMTAIAGQTI